MSYFQIKVCGITRPGDAHLAAKLGADMIGLIFYPQSRRCISPSLAREILSELPPTVDRVGVFVDETLDNVIRLATSLRLDWAQLHGKFTDNSVRTLQKSGLKVIQVFTVDHPSIWSKVRRSPANLRMLDHGQGGTGLTFDWSLAPKSKVERLVLAGGINSNNFMQGVDLFRPAMIDINSGVESSPGMKSRIKLEAFFRKANRARAKS